MSTVTLYTFAPSQNAIRPEIALLEKGVPFERVDLALFDGEHTKPPFSDLPSRGQVPTLLWDKEGEKIVVYESIAISRFIDDMFDGPKLMPPVQKAAERAKAETRIAEFQAKFDHRNIFGSVVFRKKSREHLKSRIDALLAEIQVWEGYARESAFLASVQFTLADIAVFPLLMHFEVLGYPYEKAAPALHAYMERCKARPSIASSNWVATLHAFCKNMDPEQVLAG